MHMDAPMATLTKRDGIISLMHCQERDFYTENCLNIGHQDETRTHGLVFHQLIVQLKWLI